MACLAAALTGAGTSKSGWPMLRLTGSVRLRARSNTLRMPEDSMERIRSAIQRSALSEGMAADSFSGRLRLSSCLPELLSRKRQTTPGSRNNLLAAGDVVPDDVAVQLAAGR